MTTGDLYTVRTYRYLRLAMVVLILMLLASVTFERLRSPDGCFQTSISAYYYTPVQSVFVAAVLALGVCMIVIKATGVWEDVLLNVGGVLAVVVALVPTSDAGTCASRPVVPADVAPQVENSIASLLVAGAIGLAITLWVAIRHGDLSGADVMRRGNLVGVLASGALLATGLVWFLVGPDSFIAHAHDVAAIGLFASIIAVVGLNAWDCRGDSRTASAYMAISVAIVVLGLGLVASQWWGFDHWLLVAEATVISLFAVFWLVQTDELWHVGPRPRRRTDPVGSAS